MDKTDLELTRTSEGKPEKQKKPLGERLKGSLANASAEIMRRLQMVKDLYTPEPKNPKIKPEKLTISEALKRALKKRMSDADVAKAARKVQDEGGNINEYPNEEKARIRQAQKDYVVNRGDTP